MEIGKEVRIAQCDTKCQICRKPIPKLSEFKWVLVKHKNSKGNDIIKILRACPECAEQYDDPATIL